MIFFHGWTADAEGQVGFTGLSKLAQKENFLLVYAESGNNTIGGTKGWHLPHQPGEESLDVYYVDEMIHKMKADFPRINNIYGCGHSQGGRFTIRMATDRPQYFSAMCAFAPARLGEGNPFDPDLTAYDTHHLPFFIIQGNNDSFVSLTRDYTELHEVLNEVENYNNFENPEVFASIANGDAWDWNLFSPLAGDPGTEVMWLYIDGMGHIEWPSVMSHDITTFATPMDVNDLVWEFFKKHQM
jgi:poly(3-hydroxybutyrate) depolymerase